MQVEETLKKISDMLARAEKYHLTAEVVLTAMTSISLASKKDKTDIVSYLEDACREWDV